MGKCGKGLGKEFALAVFQREVPEVFYTEELRKFIKKRGWNPSEAYVSVLLANSASSTHSKTYPQYFKSIGHGKYMLSDDAQSLL
jgi:hypothetical protein